MSHEHHHHNCQGEHSLKLCKKCDVVYCGDCSAEWSRKLSWTYLTAGTNNIVSGYATSTTANAINTAQFSTSTAGTSPTH